MTNKTKQHEEKYIHIQKRSLGFILLTLVLLALTIFSFQITISSLEFLGIDSLKCSEEVCSYYSYQLMITPMLILNYILASLTICSFVSIFKNLKRFNDRGLIYGLIHGWIIGLIVGLIVGLIGGLIVGWIGGLDEEFKK